MSFKDLPTHVQFAECVDCQRLQDLIDQQRRENPTDAHLQLIMDRQQERLDKRVSEVQEALAEIVLRN